MKIICTDMTEMASEVHQKRIVHSPYDMQSKTKSLLQKQERQTAISYLGKKEKFDQKSQNGRQSATGHFSVHYRRLTKIKGRVDVKHNQGRMEVKHSFHMEIAY